MIREKRARSFCIGNGKIILPRTIIPAGAVVVRNGIISEVLPEIRNRSLSEDLPFFNVDGNYISPGLVEMHIHGCGMYGFEVAGPSELQKAAGFLASRGVSLFLPTLQPDEKALTFAGTAVRALQKKRDTSKGLPPGISIPGLYVEGPFIHAQKRGGILPGLVHRPDPEFLKTLYASSQETIVLMTIAPEVENIASLIPAMLEKGIIPCLGHSDASVTEAEDFITALRQKQDSHNVKASITHLFNAMSPISHKRSGLAMVPFLGSQSELYVEINGDGVHLNDDILRFCYQNLDHDHIILISDAAITAGEALLQNGEETLTYFGKPVVSGKGGVRYRDSGTLVGSNRLIPDVIKHFMKVTGAPLYDAVRFATLNPSKLLGIDHIRGSLEPGKIADIAVFNSEMKAIQEFDVAPFPVHKS